MTDRTPCTPDEARAANPTDSHGTQTNLQRTILDVLIDQACEDGQESTSESWEELRGALAEGISYPWFFRQQ